MGFPTTARARFTLFTPRYGLQARLFPSRSSRTNIGNEIQRRSTPHERATNVAKGSLSASNTANGSLSASNVTSHTATRGGFHGRILVATSCIATSASHASTEFVITDIYVAARIVSRQVAECAFAFITCRSTSVSASVSASVDSTIINTTHGKQQHSF